MQIFTYETHFLAHWAFNRTNLTTYTHTIQYQSQSGELAESSNIQNSELTNLLISFFCEYLTLGSFYLLQLNKCCNNWQWKHWYMCGTMPSIGYKFLLHYSLVSICVSAQHVTYCITFNQRVERCRILEIHIQKTCTPYYATHIFIINYFRHSRL